VWAASWKFVLYGWFEGSAAGNNLLTSPFMIVNTSDTPHASGVYARAHGVLPGQGLERIALSDVLVLSQFGGKSDVCRRAGTGRFRKEVGAEQTWTTAD